MRRSWIIGFLIIILILSGCSIPNKRDGFPVEVSEKEKEFKAFYPDIDMNSAINLSDDTQPFDKTDRNIRIGITNMSNRRICFPVDFNSSILFYGDIEWEELNNLVDYTAIRGPVLEPSGDIKDFDNIIVRPDWESGAHQISEIRIVIWGEVCDGSSKGKKEGAYIDVTIE